MSPLPYTLMLNSETGVDCTRHDLKGLHRAQDLGIAFKNEAAQHSWPNAGSFYSKQAFRNVRYLIS